MIFRRTSFWTACEQVSGDKHDRQRRDVYVELDVHRDVYDVVHVEVHCVEVVVHVDVHRDVDDVGHVDAHREAEVVVHVYVHRDVDDVVHVYVRYLVLPLHLLSR